MARKPKSGAETPVSEAQPQLSSAPKTGNWFKKGTEGAVEKKKQDVSAKMRKEKAAWRFRLKDGESARVAFVDSSGFYIHEHNLKIAGKFGNFLTCIKDFGPCAVDETGNKPVYTAYYTIIDGREYVVQNGPKAGEKRKNQRTLFPAKGSAILQLADLEKKYGSLAGLVFDVKRYGAGSDSPNCGNSFTYVGKMTTSEMIKKFGPESIKPFEYEKVLAPPTDEELAAFGVGQAVVVGSVEDVGGSTDDVKDLF